MTAPALVVRHRLLVRHPRLDGLALIDARADPKLPVVVTGDAHTAETDTINAAVARIFGVRATMLRSLSHSLPVDGVVERLHELETHDVGTAPTSVRWGDVSELKNLPDPADCAAVVLWVQSATTKDPADGCEWMRVDWLDDAEDWTCGALADAGLGAAVEIRQLRNWLDALMHSIPSLMADMAALRCGEPGGLTQTECERLRDSVPGLERRCEGLAAYGIPPTIEHGDLWPGNIFVTAATAAVIDGEDVAIGHPFFSMAPLHVGLVNAGLGTAENHARLERAYLSGFSRLGAAEQLRRALALASPLCFIEMALRYKRTAPSVAALHPWMYDLVPQTLRLVLSRL